MTVAAGDAEAGAGSARLNVLVVGDTGVGKSSLVNAVLGEDHAAAGVGAPVTQKPEYFVSADGTLGVWDSPGFEHGSKKSPVEMLTRGLRTVGKAGPDKRVHVAWFCWDASSARVTDSHRTLIRTLESRGIPVIAVLTKTATQDGQVKADHLRFAQWIASEGIAKAHSNVYPTTSVLDEIFESPVYGLEDLVAASVALRAQRTG